MALTTRALHPLTKPPSRTRCRPISPATPPPLTRAPPALRPRLNTRTTTLVRSSQPSLEARQWWQEDEQLWQYVEDAQGLEAALAQSDKELVLVDWFATWCRGCRKSSPALRDLASDPSLRSRVTFVKACADGMTSEARERGARALPWVSLFTPGGEVLVGFPAVFSKRKCFQPNLQTVLDNPGKGFVVDPNGFVTPVSKSSKAAAKESKKEALEELRNFASGFSGHMGSSPLVSGVPEGSHYASQEGLGGGAQGPGRVVSDRKAEFLEEAGESYGYGGRIDDLYQKEVGCRMGPNEHYMDYTGSSVYCQSQLDAAFHEMKTHMFGNPHSQNPSSVLSLKRIEEVRRLVLKFFNADPREYQVVFTKSATAGLKMIGETFPWSEGSLFRYLRENHNSVLGIREYVLANGASFQSVDERLVSSWSQRITELDSPVPDDSAKECYNLFAFPAEDNFAGVKYPLEWIEGIKKKSTPKSHWFTLLDAAAYVPSQPLDLTEFQPDYVVCSFYKMFGFPTGLGALITKISATEILNKVFWGGGSVALATSRGNFHTLKCRPADRLEDGTVAFLDIISLKHGFGMIENLGGIEKIQAHVESLRKWLYEKLSSLRHSSGKPMVKIFGKHHVDHPDLVQGGILNIELLKEDGSVFSYKTFEAEAAESGFHIRAGIECNPGAAYNYIGVLESEIEQLAGEKEGCDDDLEYLDVRRPGSDSTPRTLDSDQVMYALEGSNVSVGHPAEVGMKWIKIPLGSIRISLGYMSTFEDCTAFADFIENNYRDRQ